MKLLALLMCAFVSGQVAFGQASFTATFIDSTTHQALIGVAVRVKGTGIGAVSNTEGLISLNGIPPGRQTLQFSALGYQNMEQSHVFPIANPAERRTISLLPTAENLDEVVVSATRTNSRIEDLPMKVEVLGIDDMEEENSIKPSGIGSILGDLSIIHIQQTSAVNASSVIRMQGLDGKYTQLLRDGLPLYEGFSGSFGVLQIPPLDLKQIEIVKGSASTLYGGGAIAGMINLVSKAPTDERELSFTLNRSSLTENNLNGYYSKKFGRFGITTFAGLTQQNAVDVNKDEFSDVPAVRHLMIHPKLFYDFSDKTKANLGISFLTETRTGGDMQAISNPTESHPYFQKNQNQRFTTDFQLVHSFESDHRLTFKGTLSSFERKITMHDFGFGGRQISGYAELSDYRKVKNMEWVYGANLTNESFRKKLPDSTLIRNFDYRTLGVFVQNGWHFTEKWLVETGLRSDFHNVFGTFVLPRIAFMYKPSRDLSIRLSSGTGYKTPNIFTSQSVSGSLRNLLPVTAGLTSEHSLGVNFDMNYTFNIGEYVTATLNQAFYYTNISKPLVYNTTTDGYSNLVNLNSKVHSVGTDTYLRFSLDRLELYLGYNHTIAKRTGDGTNVFLAFSPQDKYSSTLAYEIEGKWRFGIENAWVGNQYATVNNDLMQLRKTPSYWFWAGMVERKFGKRGSIVLNSENIFDFRQSRRESLYTGSIRNPNFVNLWGPIEGRVTNLALRLKL